MYYENGRKELNVKEKNFTLSIDKERNIRYTASVSSKKTLHLRPIADGGAVVAGKSLYMTMLFDFFGELLTEKQQEYFDLYYNEDLSLAEIAEQAGVTRQAVHDNLARAEAALNEYEQRTGIVARFEQHRAALENAQKEIGLLRSQLDGTPGAIHLNKLEELLDTLKD